MWSWWLLNYRLVLDVVMVAVCGHVVMVAVVLWSWWLYINSKL